MPVIKTGPNPNDFQVISPQALEQMPIAQYYRDVAGNIVNAQSACYYDTALFVAGTAVTQGMKGNLFTKGKAEDSAAVNTGTAITEKGSFMTNMINNGEFEGGTTFIMEGVGVQVILTADKATTYGTRGQITAPDYSASTTISAANNLQAYLENLELQYVRGEDVKKRAPLLFWPAPIGLEGAWGSPNGGFVQNGRTGLVQFSHPVVLQSEDKFSFPVECIVETFTPTMTAKIRVVLWGQAIKTFQPF
jgi:hypothetical protein